MENWVLLGASRGLGRAFLDKAMTAQNQAGEGFLQLTVFSRKIDSIPPNVNSLQSDFSKFETWNHIFSQIQALRPDRIFYFAGGGPYGKAQEKKWIDHQWALKVSFEFPAYLLYQSLKNPQNLKQMVFVGSSIAESSADPFASSYCAAKHALKGFVTSIQKEQQTPFDLRLFSPSYIDTDLLPANAWPRQQVGLVSSPRQIAEILWSYVHNADDVNKHFVLKSLI